MTTETPWKPSLKSEMLLCPSDKMFSLGHPSKRSGDVFFREKNGVCQLLGKESAVAWCGLVGLPGLFIAWRPCRHVYQSSEGIPFTVWLAASEPQISTTCWYQQSTTIQETVTTFSLRALLVASLPRFLPHHLPWIWHHFTHSLLPFEMQKVVSSDFCPST